MHAAVAARLCAQGPNEAAGGGGGVKYELMALGALVVLVACLIVELRRLHRALTLAQADADYWKWAYVRFMPAAPGMLGQNPYIVVSGGQQVHAAGNWPTGSYATTYGTPK